jgi:crotonobetainyl-CoA:carnitine CoA-transferase CaiB-like acyl-CoA transferase
MDAPLKGIRVIDWTIWQQGPVATTMLADMGAEVKIEERDKGDRAIDLRYRRIGGHREERSQFLFRGEQPP